MRRNLEGHLRVSTREVCPSSGDRNPICFSMSCRNLLEPRLVTLFRIKNLPSFTGFSVFGEGAKPDSWAMFDNITHHVPSDNLTGVKVADIGVPLFSGAGSPLYGVSPSFWGLHDNDAVALSSGAGLTENDSSRILLAFSPGPPHFPNHMNAGVGFGPWAGDYIVDASVLAPVPAPGVLLLFSSGLAGLAWLRRTRFRPRR